MAAPPPAMPVVPLVASFSEAENWDNRNPVRLKFYVHLGIISYDCSLTQAR